MYPVPLLLKVGWLRTPFPILVSIGTSSVALGSVTVHTGAEVYPLPGSIINISTTLFDATLALALAVSAYNPLAGAAKVTLGSTIYCVVALSVLSIATPVL